jgi:hypothetical protein
MERDVGSFRLSQRGKLLEGFVNLNLVPSGPKLKFQGFGSDVRTEDWSL